MIHPHIYLCVVQSHSFDWYRSNSFLPLSHKKADGVLCHPTVGAGGVYTQVCESNNSRLR